MIEIELNGTAHQVEAPCSLQELIDALELSGKSLAVAVNRQVVVRSAWCNYVLQADDRVDIVRAIGGG